MTKRQSTIRGRARRGAAAFARLVRLMDTLRSAHGCPWDRRQTHASLRRYLLEETYEAIDAIDRRDFNALPEELGDILLQCVFHAQIAAERGRFDIADAADAICRKLVRRHPHVFTASGRPLPPRHAKRSSATTPRAVKQQWSRLKADERAGAGAPKHILSGVPRALPALLRACEIGNRVAEVGFDWPRADQVVDKIEEEIGELRAALRESPKRASEEFGDLLFSIANLARKLGLDPESVLREANDKFTRRFNSVEARLAREGRSVHASSLDELERAWEAVKLNGR
jgi:MazG family protein